MEQNPVILTVFPDVDDIIHNAGFIVDRHHGDKPGVGRHGVVHFRYANHPGIPRCLRVNQTAVKVGVYAQITRRVQYAVVFHGGYKNRRFPTAYQFLFQTLDYQVVPLAAAGCEDHLIRSAVEEASNLLSRTVDRFLRDFPVGVAGTGIPKLKGQIRHHRLKDTRIHRRCCRMIEIDQYTPSPLFVVLFNCKFQRRSPGDVFSLAEPDTFPKTTAVEIPPAVVIGII